MREGILLGLGNPLLDITANVEKTFLNKYNLQSNNAILASENHRDLYVDLINSFKVTYSAGGSTQNSLRVAQWILGTPNIVSYMGCIGNDNFGKILEEKAQNDGVCVYYQYNDTQPTGTCAVLVTEGNRSLCANLGAANFFTKSHLEQPEKRIIMEKANFYYIAGFFLTVCPDAILEVAKHACSSNKLFAMNLSAPFIIQYYKEHQMTAFPYIDIIFGNDVEALTFGKEHNVNSDDVRQIALQIADLPKINKKYNRIVIITQGEKDVIVASNGKISEYPVIQLKDSEIIDTNGAGDAFVGGFLAQLIADQPLEECIRCGIYAASVILQHSGCSFPPNHNYK